MVKTHDHDADFTFDVDDDPGVDDDLSPVEEAQLAAAYHLAARADGRATETKTPEDEAIVAEVIERARPDGGVTFEELGRAMGGHRFTYRVAVEWRLRASLPVPASPDRRRRGQRRGRGRRPRTRSRARSPGREPEDDAELARRAA